MTGAMMRSSRGFTLVEMSIVLVIIGLIIGGILKGQEIIASARQKAVINQANAVRSAANTYFDRYRALPGDDKTAHTTLDANVVNGDGNGVVSTAGGTNGGGAQALLGVAGNAGEEYQFFNALIAANLLNGAQVTSATTATQFGSASALPASPITGAGLTIIYGTHAGMGATTASAKLGHWLVLHKDAASTTVAGQSAVSPRTLSNIDAQVDDGAPDQGGVRGDDSGCNTAATTTYTRSDDTTCIPFFYITD